MRTLHAIVAALVAAASLPGCAFLESALEMTFGAGQIPRVTTTFALPRPDDLELVDLDEAEDIPDFPGSLSGLTLAHVRGALRLSAECVRTRDIQPEAGGSATGPIGFTVADCDAVRCPATCAPGLSGLLLRASVPVRLLDEKQAAGLRDKLSQVSPSSILQMRLRMFDLTLGRIAAGGGAVPDAGGDTGRPDAGGGGMASSLNGVLSDLRLGARDELDHEVEIVEHRYVASISRESPQRFDIDRQSAFSSHVVSALLDAKPVSIEMVVTLVVPDDRLYAVAIDGHGLSFTAQPEFVVSVLRAAIDRL